MSYPVLRAGSGAGSFAMSAIASIHARQILDSRGNPTVEVEVTLDSGGTGARRGALRAPRPASTRRSSCATATRALGRQGRHASGGQRQRRDRRGAGGRDAAEQGALDATMIELDGTPNKGKLGANAILGVSLAAAQGGRGRLRPCPSTATWPSHGGGEPSLLPVPDDEHPQRRRARRQPVDFQEFMVVPVGAPSFARGLRVGAEIFHALKKCLEGAGYATAVGDEGGFAPNLESNEEALEVDPGGDRGGRLRAGHGRRPRPRPGDQRVLRGRRVRARARGHARSLRARWSAYWDDACVGAIPIVSIEDGMAEEDWDGWKLLTDRLGERVQLVGDDLFVTNPERLRRGIEQGVGQLDPGQGQPDRHPDRDARGDPDGPRGRLHGGHLAPLGRDRGHDHRRPRRRHQRRPDQDRRALAARDRVAKYNQLLRIEEELGANAEFPGLQAFARTPG